MRKFNFNGAAIGASLTLTISLILAEIVEPFKELLKSLFSHHWIGKLFLTIIAFITFGYFIQKSKIFSIQIEKLAWLTTIISLATIFLFFTILYFK